MVSVGLFEQDSAILMMKHHFSRLGARPGPTAQGCPGRAPKRLGKVALSN